MKTRQEFYSSPHEIGYDYQNYVSDCLEWAIETVGADYILDALSKSLDTDTLGDHLEYIDRVYELGMDNLDIGEL